MKSGKTLAALTLIPLLAFLGATALAPPAARGAEGCKVKVLKTGEVQVAAKNVHLNPRWGTSLSNITAPFSNEGTCYLAADLQIKGCNLGSPTTLSGVTMPATCQVCVGDDGPTDCCTRIKKCTPGIRVRDGSFAAGDPRFEAFEVPDASTIRVSAMNLQIVNGLGQTAPFVNGRGNLIIGYNEQHFAPKARTGSHNLVVGMDHGWTSTAGFVAGNDNSITGASATILGGYSNTASGTGSAVSGGAGNLASGVHSSVTGGSQNTASGQSATVSGGAGNIAAGSFASVSGGYNNKADGSSSSISGGAANAVYATEASVSGGYTHQIASTSNYAAITGGLNNTISGTGSCDTISGGTTNTVSSSGGFNTIGGGVLVSIGGAVFEEWHASRNGPTFPTGTEY